MKYLDLNHKVYIDKINKKSRLVLLTQFSLIIIFLLIWEVGVNLGILDIFIFSKPSKIFDLLIDYFSTGEIYKHIKQSLIEVSLGLVIGTSLGIIIALVMWFSRFIQRILNPFLIVLNALPKTALAPIFIIWIGANTKGIVFVVISISIVITIINALHAFNNVNVDQIKMLRSFKATKIQILKYLVLPSNTNNLINITKVNIGMSWIGVIVGEFIVSRFGLGYLITYGTQVFRLDLVMMSVFILAILTMLMNITFDLLILGCNYIKRLFINKERKFK